MDDEENTNEERSFERLIEEHDWNAVFDRLRERPEEAREISNPSVGWTKLHWLCSVGSVPLTLIEQVAALYPEAITMPDNRYGDTPLHLIGRNSLTSANKMKTLLSHLVDNEEGVLIRNRFGGTPLHSAANHNAVLEVLQELVRINPRLLKVATYDGIHAVSALYHAYIQTIPGYMAIARILEGQEVDSSHFDRFWKKFEFLSTEYFKQSPACPENLSDASNFVLHGLIQCHVQINCFKLALKRNPAYARALDANGNTPLHVLVESRPFRLKEKEAIVGALEAYPDAAGIRNNAGDLPLFIAIRNKIPWQSGLDEILKAYAAGVQCCDPETNLLPFQLAAAVGGKFGVEISYHLLSIQPDLLGA